jgi:hyperosmotically inducible periplasmic protein
MKGSSRPIVMASAAFLFACSALAQNADNTERNVSDRSNQTVTPMAQGNNKADLATTAKIRKEIISSNPMSVNAQNVKIVTNAGKVTLRGPVDTAEEKRLIGEIAMKYASPGNVDNQLDVKAVTDNGGPGDQPAPPNKPKGQ